MEAHFRYHLTNRLLDSYPSIEKPVTAAALCQRLSDEFQVVPIKVTSKLR
ncbi:MAG TPA: hypothetical protein VJS91_03880 [Nitrososphaeraceae archaeon]|nr:hypothetical protein [Nitrososphaeraceae archaeon]